MNKRGTAIPLGALLLLGSVVLPEPADARSHYRRNYAEEMRQEDLREERQREYERRREQEREHQQELQRRWQKHSERQSQRDYDHRERQTDKVLDFHEGRERERAAPRPAAPAATGTCIYGPGDEVLHQPKGVVCAK